MFTKASRLRQIDILPQFSARVRRLARTPHGILIAAILVSVLTAVVVHPRVFALSAGLVTALATGICWPWLTCRGLRGRLHYASSRAVEGESVRVALDLVNHLPWAARGLIVRAAGSTDPATSAAPNPAAEVWAKLPRIAARARSTCYWQWTPPLRGRYPVAPPLMATAFPFGLWEAKRVCQVDAPLIVWPRTVSVGPVPVPEMEDVTEGTVSRGRVGNSGDILGVRPYRRGDSPRRIHWAQSARHDRLIVCELQASTRPVVLLVFDNAIQNHTLGPDGTYEWAIRVTASLAKGWIEQGAEVGLVAGETRLRPQSGQEQVTRILDTLAAVQPDHHTLESTLRDRRVQGESRVTKLVITTDHAELDHPTMTTAMKWVILEQAGFGGTSPAMPSQLAWRAWLTLPNPEETPTLLREGTVEARHGT